MSINLVNAICLRTGLTAQVVEKVMNTYAQAVTTKLKVSGTVIKIDGLGSLRSYHRGGYKTLNPKNGQLLTVPEKILVRFSREFAKNE